VSEGSVKYINARPAESLHDQELLSSCCDLICITIGIHNGDPLRL
jgi:hypothetical protein